MQFLSRPSASLPFSHRAASALLLLFLAASILASTVSAQSAGDYRTRSSGSWTKKNTWQRFNGSSWVNANSAPNWSDGQITIRTGHTVNGNGGNDYDQVVIEAGATLSISKPFTVIDGPGTDLEVYGELIVNNGLVLQDSATAVFEANSILDINRGDSFSVLDTSSVLFSSMVTITSAGDFIVDGNASATLASGTTFTNENRGTIDVSGNGTLSFTGSTLINEDEVTTGGSGSISFDGSSEYVHANDGGAFPPAASTTWAAGSTASVTGTDRNIPDGLDGQFSNFIWDNPDQSRNLDLAGALSSIAGDLTVSSTGNRALTFDAGGTSINVGGNYIQDGGDVVFLEDGTATMTVGGDFELNGGSFNLAVNSGSPTLEVGGDLLVSGSLDNTGSGVGTIALSSSSTQIIDVSGSLSGLFDLELGGTGEKQLASDLTLNGSLTETNGGLDLNGFDLTLSGNLDLNSPLQNAGLLTFNGSDPASLSGPSPLEIDEMVIDKAPSTLTLLSDLEIGTSLIIRGGDLEVNGFTVILGPGATFYNASGAPFPGDVTIERSWTDASDGWRMLTVPVSGLSYSDLNGTFWTQGASWATKTDGMPNLQAFDFSTQGWSPMNGGDGSFSPGGGYILYMFAEDDAGSSILPATWTVTGTPGSLSAQGLSWSGSAATSWNLVGNPTASNLDWDDSWSASTAINASYATWDPGVTSGGGTTGYKYYDASSGIGSAGRYIAPFTAFMVQSTGGSATFQPATNEAAANGSVNLFGKGNDGMAPHIRLHLEGEGLAEQEMVLSFGAEATDASSLFDVIRLNPLSAQFATIWSETDGRRLAFDGRTMSEGRETYDLAVATTQAGVYTISSGILHDLPSTWTIRLVDLTNGNQVALTDGEELTFRTTSADLVRENRGFDSERKARFRIVVEDQSRSLEQDDSPIASVDTAVLAQNFPNPFQESTTIRFSIPKSSPVKLEVFDMIGRRIAVLIDGQLEAGWHQALFNADSYANGMYSYRLSYGGHSLTHLMVKF